MKPTPHTLRIIGGKWRSRRLIIPPVASLRPTPDRVRETLFNWLTPMIADAYCLDLFTGSGILGFEALSRGAAYVEMVDQSLVVIDTIKQALQTFAVTEARAYQATIPKELQAILKPFNIVFLDPPYSEEKTLLDTCYYLENHQFLTPIAYIYLEAGREILAQDLPTTWQLEKSKQAGNVFYHLAKRDINREE